MIKITRNLLESLGWKKDDFFEDNNIYVYKSPDGRCELTHGKDSNLSDEDGYECVVRLQIIGPKSGGCSFKPFGEKYLLPRTYFLGRI